ncbi:MAG: DNA polymerase I [Clostridia bacterium]|nr:DNA polymerase I [Clostridia bacterium]
MKKFLVIDGNSIMNRAFYGLSANMTSSYLGIHTNAVYGFLNIYWMIEDKIKPDYIAVSFDLKAPTFRHKMYDEYKGTRKGMPEELAEQMGPIKEVLTAMNIPILELEGYEADDILGTVAKTNMNKGIFTYILTGDKDSFQLISDTTSIIIPTTRFGKTEYTIYTPELLKEKQNIEPYQVVHIKSLMGDSSDNIPGVKGIGEKTAYSLIEKYTTLENIYTNIEQLDASQKIKEKLVNDKEMAYLSKELATIDQEVPVTIDYDKCIVSSVNLDELFKLFKKLEFNKFMSKFDFTNISNDDNQITSKIEIEVSNFYLLNSNNIHQYRDELKAVFSEDKIAYILNYNYDNFVPNCYLNNKSIFGVYSNAKDSIYVIDIEEVSKKTPEILKTILEDFVTADVVKLGYNIKQDLLFFFRQGLSHLTHFDYDLMIAYYLMNPSRNNYLMDYILNDLFELSIEKENLAETKQLSMFEENSDDEELLTAIQMNNIKMYLKGIYLSHDIITKKLKELEMLTLFLDIEMPLTETLASMEYHGMYIDLTRLNEFDAMISTTLNQLEEEIYHLAGETFNINSTQQLGVVLFEKLSLPTVKKNKTGYSTDKTVLEELSEQHPIIDKVLEYRQTMKLKSTYVDGLRDKIADDGRIHTTFMQTVTTTGRLSSIEPNLQNIPIKLELGSKIRDFFTAEGMQLLVDSDYSQIELRVLAHISNDEVMIDSFKNHIDIHKVTASQVFNIPLEDVTSTMRSHAKAVNFGIVYGISEFGLAKNIGSTRYEAKQYIENYLNKYQGIHSFMTEIVKKAKEVGYVNTIFGRRRYIPELNSKNKNIIQFGERIAMNTPIQGSAADIIKLAMNKIYKEIKDRNLKSKLIMQVHDELIIETHQDEIEVIKEIMKDSMENIVKLNVPLEVDLNIGKSWYEAK